MADFEHIVTFPAIAKCDGKPRHLTAKIVCDRIVFAGGERGQRSIPVTHSLPQINQAWAVYCWLNTVTGTKNLPFIDQGDLERARGIF